MEETLRTLGRSLWSCLPKATIKLQPMSLRQMAPVLPVIITKGQSELPSAHCSEVSLPRHSTRPKGHLSHLCCRPHDRTFSVSSKGAT